MEGITLKVNTVLRWFLIGFVLALLLLGGGLLLYTQIATAAPEPVALAALESDDQVEVSEGKWITFSPRTEPPTTGLILYPGGFVDPRAYAPVARQIAAAGYQVVIPRMPLNLAVLGASRASEVMTAYPHIENWAVGGHSLGGAMAAQYASRNSDTVDALILWAAYPPSGVDLSEHDLVATSIYGTRDGLVSQAEIDASRRQLPPATRFVPIEGGNHAQFGSYGPQEGDLAPEIGAEDQQAQIALATIATLDGGD
jgi:pimeloyl-ACP methyl ester carboxylesterase